MWDCVSDDHALDVTHADLTEVPGIRLELITSLVWCIICRLEISRLWPVRGVDAPRPACGDVMMMLGVTSLMPADEGCFHLGGMEADASSTLGSPCTTPCPGRRLSPLRNDDRLPVGLLAAAVGDGRLTTAVRRRLSPPVDELNTPATFTPTYSCGHFVFDAVGDFALTTVDDLPANGQKHSTTSSVFDPLADLGRGRGKGKGLCFSILTSNMPKMMSFFQCVTNCKLQYRSDISRTSWRFQEYEDI